MENIDKYDTIVNTFNNISFFYKRYLMLNGYVFSDDILDVDMLDEVIVSIISLIYVMQEEDIIEKKEELQHESKIYEEVLKNNMIKISKKIDDNLFQIGPIIETPSNLYAIIRNKLAHGDYYYDKKSKEIVLNKKEGDMRININQFLSFYLDIETKLHGSYKDTVFTRSILENKSKNITKKIIETDEEFDTFIKLFKVKNFSLKRKDDGVIPYGIKNELNNMITEYYKYSSIKDHKLLNDYIMKHFEKKGYYVTITTTKIKDKDIKEKIKHAIIGNADAKDYENDPILFTLIYGNIVSKIVNEKYPTNAVYTGCVVSLMTIQEMIKNNSCDLSEVFKNFTGEESFITNAYTMCNEFAASINLAKFNSLYCYPLDDWFNKDKNYHLERDNIFDYKKLNLSFVNPEILLIENKEIKDIEKMINKCNKNIENTKYIIERHGKNIEGITKKQNISDHEKAYLETIKNDIISATKKLEKLYLELERLKSYEKLVNQDYKENEAYFRNRAIIEGIRNSISHGNIKLYDYTSNDIDNTKIEFLNEYKGKVYFKLIISIKDFEKFFYIENIDIIQDFISKKRDEERPKLKAYSL